VLFGKQPPPYRLDVRVGIERTIGTIDSREDRLEGIVLSLSDGIEL
jgi:hypothetical protein